MFAPSLEETLNEMFQTARSQGAEFVGVEDLLLGLLNDAKCRELLVALGANVEEVEGDLSAYIESQIPHAGTPPNKEVNPTLGFQRVLKRAITHVQSSGKREISSMNILVALFSEQESEATRLLAEQGIERKEVVRKLGKSDSQSSIEMRLDELEKKLDTAIGEIRELSAILRQWAEQPPPNT